MPESVVFYDLLSKDGIGCFSPNAWKSKCTPVPLVHVTKPIAETLQTARSALNFKGIPYETKWMEFPDIAPTFKSLGIPPNTPIECQFEYSCPTVQLPDGTFVMESRKIADALEKLQPEPSLRLDTQYLERATNIFNTLLFNIGIGMFGRIPDLLHKRGAEWYVEERKKVTGGIPISDFDGQFRWDVAEPTLGELRHMLNENPEGPYFMGREVSYADLIIVSLWQVYIKTDKGDMVDRIMGFDKSILEHFEACKKWFARNDH